MKPKLKKKWVEALRSGNYEQGIGCLRDAKDKFCCLGVLCDIIDPDKWEESTRIGQYYYGGNGRLTLTDPMLESIGLPGDIANDLMNMNDGEEREQKAFSEIADYIEASNEI